MIPNLTGSLSGFAAQLPAVAGTMAIIPIKKVGPMPVPVGPPFLVQFNPETYSISHRADYHEEQAKSETKKESKFGKFRPRRFDFEFFFDGTGASGEKREVIAEVELFKRIAVNYNGSFHRPHVVALIWGTFMKIAVLEKMDLKYTLLRTNGMPLRATISASFLEHTEKLVALLEKQNESPDLTTHTALEASETLPLKCRKVYDDPRHYIEVARANNLTTFRNIKPGKLLDFPPVEKT